MPKFRRRTYNLLMLITALTAVVLLWRIDNDQQNLAPQRDTSSAPAWIVTQPVIEHFDSEGLMLGRVKAAELEYYHHEKTAKLLAPQLEEGELVENQWQMGWYAVAESGLSKNLGSHIDLNGDVNVYNLLHHYHLQSDTLHANRDSGILRSDAPVKVNGPDSELSANGVIANWHQQRIELIENVDVTIRPR